jgi:uncharacterized protein YbaP (TraB family)
VTWLRRAARGRRAGPAPLAAAALAIGLWLGGADATASQPLFMWTVRSPEATVHLLGSVHVGTPDFYPFDPVIEAAFAGSDGLAVELDVTDPETTRRSAQLFLQRALCPAEESLADHLDPQTYRALTDYAQAHQVPMAVVGRMRPAAAAMFLALEEMRRLGYDPELGVDVHFLRRAGPDRQVRALETVEQQIEAIFGGDDQVAELLLTEFLTQTAALDSVMTEMMNAWRSGDAARMDELITRQMLDDPRLRAFHDRILRQRNKRMFAAIEDFLDGDQTWFVIVGAAHLVGSDGLVAWLSAAGYFVSQAQATPTPERVGAGD